MRCIQTVEAGSYVLGALAPAERSGYEQHVAACPECRNAVAELAGLPGLLGRLDADSAAAIGRPERVPDRLLDSVLAGVRTERTTLRRRRRWERGLVVLTAACLAILIGAGVSTMSIPAAPPPVLGVMTPVSRDEPITALIGYWSDHKGGTEIRLSCAYASADAGQSNEQVRLWLWVYPKDGGPGTSVWWWDAGPGYRDTFFMETDLRPDQIGRFEVRDASTVLLSYRP
jgi:anti-sigma-K factor RskA